MKFEDILRRAKREWEDFNRLDKPRVLIGAATCGRAAGALAVRERFEAELARKGIAADVTEVGCLGACYAEPLVEIGLADGRRVLYRYVTDDDVEALVGNVIINGDIKHEKAACSFGDVAVDGLPKFEELPMIAQQVRVVLRNAGIIDPANINHYVARGGYAGLMKTLAMSQEEVCDEMTASGLRGRGGAGFPTGVKWGFARKSSSDVKYMVCNADEGDPGAFMDRSVLESDPHAVLEGLAIGAYAIGASDAIVYARAEYPLAIARLENAIGQMKENGFLGKNIMGSDFSLNVKIKMGAGAFVCGEETALMASIEGKRGMPRPRPPFPANEGLYGKPTNINNVETLANVSEIMHKGAKWYAGYGTEKSRGTKTFALAGKINRTGLIEVPMGIKLRDIIFTIGGGVPDGKKFKAVQTGGPSGGSIPADCLDSPVDYEELARLGSIVGSGGMIVMDEDSCMVDVTKYFLGFTHSESCGKCVPCRVGSQHLLRMFEEITNGTADISYLDKLEKLANTVKSGALCGLGQTLPNPVLSTLRYFKDELIDHLVNKKCEAMVCKGLISAPCRYTCPINQDVPGYMGYVAQGKYDDAIRLIRKDNPLPGICGRVCPHPCESSCEAGKHGDPIAIRHIKRFAADYEMKKGFKPDKSEVRHEEKVAIIGSGPAGLSCGYFLAREGYECTIFESLPVEGGMLAVGIPEYRLPEDVLEYEIDYIKKTGVEIITNQALGKDFTIDDLFKRGYKAVFMAVGSHKPFELRVEGMDLPEVLPGVEFLHRANTGEEVKIGKRVAVIGGGNVAVDSARVAARIGAEKVFIVYRRSLEEMPALEEELHQLQEEGIEIKFLAAPSRALSEDGKLTGIECVKMQLGEPDDSGRRRPVPVKGSEFIIECDNLITAIGQTSDLDFAEAEGMGVTDRGTIEVDKETDLTERDGVFAGGDSVTGPLNVVTALAHGKLAAKGIRQYLTIGKVTRDYVPLKPTEDVATVELSDSEIEKLIRPQMPCKPGGERVKSFVEVEEGLSEDAAVIESRRCLRCDLMSS